MGEGRRVAGDVTITCVAFVGDFLVIVWVCLCVWSVNETAVYP